MHINLPISPLTSVLLVCLLGELFLITTCIHGCYCRKQNSKSTQDNTTPYSKNAAPFDIESSRYIILCKWNNRLSYFVLPYLNRRGIDKHSNQTHFNCIFTQSDNRNPTQCSNSILHIADVQPTRQSWCWSFADHAICVPISRVYSE
jgi:hypothetical protein